MRARDKRPCLFFSALPVLRFTSSFFPVRLSARRRPSLAARPVRSFPLPLLPLDLDGCAGGKLVSFAASWATAHARADAKTLTPPSLWLPPPRSCLTPVPRPAALPLAFCRAAAELHPGQAAARRCFGAANSRSPRGPVLIDKEPLTDDIGGAIGDLASHETSARDDMNEQAKTTTRSQKRDPENFLVEKRDRLFWPIFSRIPTWTRCDDFSFLSKKKKEKHQGCLSFQHLGRYWPMAGLLFSSFVFFFFLKK